MLALLAQDSLASRTPIDALGSLAIGIGVLMLGVLLYGIGRRIARRRRR